MFRPLQRIWVTERTQRAGRSLSSDPVPAPIIHDLHPMVPHVMMEGTVVGWVVRWRDDPIWFQSGIDGPVSGVDLKHLQAPSIDSRPQVTGHVPPVFTPLNRHARSEHRRSDGPRRWRRCRPQDAVP